MFFRKVISVSRAGLSSPLLSCYVRQSKLNHGAGWRNVLKSRANGRRIMEHFWRTELLSCTASRLVFIMVYVLVIKLLKCHYSQAFPGLLGCHKAALGPAELAWVNFNAWHPATGCTLQCMQSLPNRQRTRDRRRWGGGESPWRYSQEFTPLQLLASVRRLTQEYNLQKKHEEGFPFFFPSHKGLN